MLDKAIEQAFPEEARCLKTEFSRVRVVEVDDLDFLVERTRALKICGVNTGVIIERVREAYRELSKRREPDELDQIKFPEKLVPVLDILRENGVITGERIIELGVVGLTKLPRIGDKTAAALLQAVGPSSVDEAAEGE